MPPVCSARSRSSPRLRHRLGHARADGDRADSIGIRGGPVGQRPAASASGLKAVYVSTGPIGQNPFLELIAAGLEEGGNECGVETRVVESADTPTMEDNLQAAVSEGYDLIVANSFDSVDAVTRLAGENPDQKWAIVDSTVDSPNVRGLVFKEHEGTYLLGATLGLLAKGEHEGFPESARIGAVGALDAPFIRRWLVGFEEGAKAVNPSITIDSAGPPGSTTRRPARNWRSPRTTPARSTCSPSRPPATPASSRRRRSVTSSRPAWTRTSARSTRITSSSRW